MVSEVSGSAWLPAVVHIWIQGDVRAEGKHTLLKTQGTTSLSISLCSLFGVQQKSQIVKLVEFQIKIKMESCGFGNYVWGLGCHPSTGKKKKILQQKVWSGWSGEFMCR